MIDNKYSVRKYFVSTTLATAFVFSSMLAGGASANGGPGSEPITNDTSVTEQKQPVQSKSAPVSNSNLTKGDSGQAVKELQKTLQAKGQTANPDGTFGIETEGAVKNVQSNHEVEIEDVATSQGSNDQAEETVNQSNQTDIVSIANSVVGKPYTPGGTTPAGFDSSGFINYVFDKAGVSLDRTHASMWANNGTHVDSPNVGDVVFFENTYKNGVSHSGIYLGDNQMVHAGTSNTGV